MHNEIRFHTEVDCGFHLPVAYKSHDGQLKQILVIATLFSGTACAAILAVNIFG